MDKGQKKSILSSWLVLLVFNPSIFHNFHKRFTFSFFGFFISVSKKLYYEHGFLLMLDNDCYRPSMDGRRAYYEWYVSTLVCKIYENFTIFRNY